MFRCFVARAICGCAVVVASGIQFSSASLGHAITKKLTTYIEFTTEIPTTDGSWQGTFDTGLIYQPPNQNWQLDAGVNIGVTKAANGLFPFVGAAWLF